MSSTPLLLGELRSWRGLLVARKVDLKISRVKASGFSSEVSSARHLAGLRLKAMRTACIAFSRAGSLTVCFLKVALIAIATCVTLSESCVGVLRPVDSRNW